MSSFSSSSSFEGASSSSSSLQQSPSSSSSSNLNSHHPNSNTSTNTTTTTRVLRDIASYLPNTFRDLSLRDFARPFNRSPETTITTTNTTINSVNNNNNATSNSTNTTTTIINNNNTTATAASSASLSSSANSGSASINASGIALYANSLSLSSLNRDRILAAYFETVNIGGQCKLFLLLGYSNGFAVWNISDPENPECVASRHEVAIKIVKFVPEPDLDRIGDDRFRDARPLIAIVAAEADVSFPKGMVKFYSLKTHKYVHRSEHEHDIFALAFTPSLMIVAKRDKLCGFDPLRMTPAFPPIPCFPHGTFSPHGVLALGPRWLAYAGNEPIPAGGSGNLLQVSNPTLAERSLDVAKNVASGLYYLGDLGIRKVSNYINPNAAADTASTGIGGAPVSADGSGGILSDAYAANTTLNGVVVPPNMDTTYAGTVIVRDIKSNRTIAQFRAHNQPLSVIAFDPSGTLLATASIEGTYVHVYQIMPGEVRHLYKLYRGITSALIHEIRFNTNSRWISVSSSHGTTHLYAINPIGGAVNSMTHTSAVPYVPLSASPEITLYMESFAARKQENEPLVLSVTTRIRSNSETIGGVSVDPDPRCIFMPTADSSEDNQLSTSRGTEQLYVATHVGSLTRFHLSPRAENVEGSSSTGPAPLALDVEEVESRILGREKNDAEIERPVIVESAPIRRRISNANSLPPSAATSTSSLAPVAVENAVERSRWISNVEIETYATPIFPLWVSGQFRFKTLQACGGNIAASLPSIGNSSITNSILGSEDVFSRCVEINKRVKPTISSGVFDSENASSVHMPESRVSGSIVSAMGTPIDIARQPQQQQPLPPPSQLIPQQPQQYMFHNLQSMQPDEEWEPVANDDGHTMTGQSRPHHVSYITALGEKVYPDVLRVEDTADVFSAAPPRQTQQQQQQQPPHRQARSSIAEDFIDINSDNRPQPLLKLNLQDNFFSTDTQASSDVNPVIAGGSTVTVHPPPPPPSSAASAPREDAPSDSATAPTPEELKQEERAQALYNLSILDDFYAQNYPQFTGATLPSIDIFDFHSPPAFPTSTASQSEQTLTSSTRQNAASSPPPPLQPPHSAAVNHNSHDDEGSISKGDRRRKSRHRNSKDSNHTPSTTSNNKNHNKKDSSSASSSASSSSMSTTSNLTLPFPSKPPTAVLEDDSAHAQFMFLPDLSQLNDDYFVSAAPPDDSESSLHQKKLHNNDDDEFNDDDDDDSDLLLLDPEIKQD